jgi:hypothetical protein
MRRTRILVASLSFLGAVFAVSTSAQSGEKQHRADSISTKSGAVPAGFFMLRSDSTASGRSAAETTPIMHVSEAQAAQIAVKWQFNGVRGFTELILLADGGWKLMGTFNNAGTPSDLDVVIALKSTSGTVFIFHRVGSAPAGEHQWDASASSPTIAREFHSLTQGFDVRGAYRLPTPVVGSTEQKAEKNEGACETTASTAWTPIWSWAAAQHKCYQLNIAN